VTVEPLKAFWAVDTHQSEQGMSNETNDNDYAHANDGLVEFFTAAEGARQARCTKSLFKSLASPVALLVTTGVHPVGLYAAKDIAIVADLVREASPEQSCASSMKVYGKAGLLCAR
jgi:hypothetical protein